MIIKDSIIDPFQIHVEDRQFVLKERKVYGEKSKKTGEYLVDEAYHGDLKTMIRPLARRLLARQEAEVTLTEFLVAYKTLLSKIERIVDKI